MKILFIITSMGSGGAEKLLYDMVPVLNEYHQCEVLAISDKNDRYSECLVRKRCKCTFIPDTIKLHFAKIQYIKRYIVEGKFDIVHAHLFPPLYYCAYIKFFMLKNIPFIFTEHNIDNRRRHIKWIRPLEKWIYKTYDYVISISGQTEEKLLKWLDPAIRDKYVTIHNGIPLYEFTSAVQYDRNQLGLNVKEDDILLCMIGSFTIQKNHKFMVEVMNRLSKKFKLLLLGEGPLEEEIRKKIMEDGLEDQVFSLGFRRDIPALIKASDIVVIPSLWEGFGLIAVEAMACGRQVVCSDVPGLAEVVGDVGVKVTLNDYEGFVRAIKWAAGRAGDIDVKNQCIEQAKRFDIREMIKGYMEIYATLAGGKQQG